MMTKDFIVTVIALKGVMNLWHSVNMISQYQRELKEKIVVTKKITKILQKRILRMGPSQTLRFKRNL